MDDYELGHAFATRALLIVLINNLRGLKVLNDQQVQEILDETLQALEETHADMEKRYGPSSRQSVIVAAARRTMELELTRELSYPKRDRAPG